MTIQQLYHQSVKRLPKNIPEISVRTLLLKSQGFSSMSQLYIHFQDEVLHVSEFESDFARLLQGEPEAYIVGKSEFLGNTFSIDSRVLIPRNETEEWMQMVIDQIHKDFADDFTFLDIGTGSGVIAISLKKAFPKSEGWAIDISLDALEVAQENAKNLQANIHFLSGDLLEPLKKNPNKFHVILSNPPYIENKDEVDPSVALYEPPIALYAEHGIDCYERILSEIAPFLQENFLIVFEINYDQKERLEEITREYLPFSQFECRKDSYGKWRSFWIWNKK